MPSTASGTTRAAHSVRGPGIGHPWLSRPGTACFRGGSMTGPADTRAKRVDDRPARVVQGCGATPDLQVGAPPPPRPPVGGLRPVQGSREGKQSFVGGPSRLLTSSHELPVGPTQLGTGPASIVSRPPLTPGTRGLAPQAPAPRCTAGPLSRVQRTRMKLCTADFNQFGLIFGGPPVNK